MRKHVIMFFSVFCCLWFCCGWFCNKSLDVSAETYTKWTVQETVNFYGSDIPFNYTIGGTTQSGTFHALPYNSRTNKITGLNIEQNAVINGASGSAYDIIMYCTNDFIATPSDSIDIDIPIDLYYTGGFRSFVGCMVGFNNVTSSDNLISNHPDNVFGLQRALSANSSADSSLANYYNLGTFQFAKDAITDTPYSNTPCRLLTFDDVDGAVASIRFQGARTFGADYYLYLIVATPYSYGDVSHDSPITTTATDAAELPPITVNVDVDLGPVVSGLDGIAGQVAQAKDDVQGIATDISAIGSLLAVDEQQTQSVLYLDPIDTLPTLDYHQVIDDVDGVLDDIPSAVAGTASIWGIISAFFTSDSVWLWLVPLCIFLCLASFVLWRR